MIAEVKDRMCKIKKGPWSKGQRAQIGHQDDATVIHFAPSKLPMDYNTVVGQTRRRKSKSF